MTITKFNSIERGSGNNILSAHAGRALGGASCVLSGGHALGCTGTVRLRKGLWRGGALCSAGFLLLFGWGFCCFFCFVFYQFDCKTCAEPLECVLSKRAPLLTLSLSKSEKVCLCLGVCAGVCRCADPRRGLPAVGTGRGGCLPGHTHPPRQAVHWAQGRARFFTHPIHTEVLYRDLLAYACPADLAALDCALWDSWNFYQVLKVGESC